MSPRMIMLLLEKTWIARGYQLLSPVQLGYEHNTYAHTTRTADSRTKTASNNFLRHPRKTNLRLP